MTHSEMKTEKKPSAHALSEKNMYANMRMYIFTHQLVRLKYWKAKHLELAACDEPGCPASPHVLLK